MTALADGFGTTLRALEARLFDGPVPAAVLGGNADPTAGPVPHPVFRPQRRRSLVVTWHAGVRQRDPRQVDTDDFFTVLPPRLAPFLRRVRFHGSAAECLEAFLRDLLEDVAAEFGMTFNGGLKRAGHPSRLRRYIPLR